MIVQQEPEKPSLVSNRARGTSRGISASKTAWGDLDVLCLTAMHKDPERRYPSVEALIRDVDHYLQAEPLEARPDSTGYRLDKFIRRNRRAVSVGAAVLAVVMAIAVFFTIRLAKARNAAIEEAARTQRIQRFMMDLFQGGDESVGPSGELRVVTLLDRGVQEARTLSSDPKVQAELYHTLGTIYDQLGKFDQADTLLNVSLEERKKIFGPDSSEVANTMVALVKLRVDQARFDEAEQLASQALDMTKRHLPFNNPAVGKATAALGRALSNRGSYDQAIQVLDQAVTGAIWKPIVLAQADWVAEVLLRGLTLRKQNLMDSARERWYLSLALAD